MICSRSIAELEPMTRFRVQELLKSATSQGIDLLVTSTYRDFEQQQALYNVGRTVKGANPRLLRPMGDKVTNATPGSSWHNWACAVDVVPIVGGKAAWNDSALWAEIGAIGEAEGLEWAGRWKSFKELAHFQYPNGNTLANLLQLHPKGL